MYSREATKGFIINIYGDLFLRIESVLFGLVILCVHNPSRNMFILFKQMCDEISFKLPISLVFGRI